MGWKGKGNNICTAQLCFAEPYTYYSLSLFQPISPSLLPYERYIYRYDIVSVHI